MSARAWRNLVALVLGILLGAVAQRGFALPAGGVVAFNLSSCPTGWTPVAGLAGRMVVGVGTLGSDVYALGDTGGAARVALESQHNGPHTHSFNQAGWGGSVLVAGGSFTSFYHTHFGATTGSSGLGTPHENRPAYLALLFCSLDVDEPGGDGGMNEPGVLGISPAEALYFLMCVGVIALYALGFVVGQQR